MKRNSINTIIFDLDGTLVDSLEDIMNATNHTLQKFGIAKRSREEIADEIGTGSRSLIKITGNIDDEELLDKAHAEFTSYFNEHSTDKSRLYPHTKETLEYLGDKSLFVLTNRTQKMAEVTLEHFGIKKYFNEIIGAEENCKKPSACTIEDSLKKCSAEKCSCMLVGDMEIDIETGRNAGLLTCGVTYGIGKKEKLTKAAPDYLINDISELRSIV